MLQLERISGVCGGYGGDIKVIAMSHFVVFVSLCIICILMVVRAVYPIFVEPKQTIDKNI